MATLNLNSVITVKSSNSSVVINKSRLQDLETSGIIHEDYFQLRRNTLGAEFDVMSLGDFKMKSRKGTEVQVPKLQFSNADSRFIVLGHMMLNALVMDNYEIHTPRIDKANGMNIWFRDEFTKEFPALTQFSNVRNDGGISIYDRHFIIGALVSRSSVDETRWAISGKHYVKYELFLRANKVMNPTLDIKGVGEKTIHELANASKKDRTFTDAIGTFTVPFIDELVINSNADTDPRWAYGQLLIAKTW